MFRSDAILSADPEGLEVLHDREYRVRAFQLADDRILIRGAVRDQKPPGAYVEGDPDPLTMHHMQVDLEIGFPSMQIVAAEVVFDIHPHTTCPDIVSRYQQLVGLSIARGYTHRVRELFGGPRGCTHVTALLLAMGPVATQCRWSMHAASARQAGQAVFTGRASMSPEQREGSFRANTNTCHVWAEDGEMIAAAVSGAPAEVPLQLQRRFRDLGVPEDQWNPEAG